MLLFLSSCGLFKKTVDKDVTRSRSEVRDRSTVRLTELESRDLSTVDFTRLRIRKEPSSNENDTTIEQALITAVEGATDLEAILSREQLERLTQGRERAENRDIRDNQEHFNKTKDLDKESDTTWTANFPPWLILAIAALIIGAVFLYYKTRRP